MIRTSLIAHFSNIGKINDKINDASPLLENINNESQSENDTKPTLDKLSLSYEDVLDAISQCKNNKSPGIDSITNEIIKNGGDIIAMSMYKLFKRLVDLEKIPDEWNEGTIIPIFKKGDHRDLNNYRGITLNSCVSKIYNRIISQTVSNFIEEHDLLTEVQGGFRKDRRCEDHIFVLKSIIATRQAEGKKTYLTFLDFKKAFDTVWREGLLFAIKQLGIKGSLLNIIKGLYTDVKCRVLFNDLKTELFTVNEGVKQGCPLSPLLFSIFINE